ncbi:MAG: hypothetical protein IT437_13330 [Phycisphaerales bacterium]|nr:hypothetical protein [Phycisphaerales bacterium]
MRTSTLACGLALWVCAGTVFGQAGFNRARVEHPVRLGPVPTLVVQMGAPAPGHVDGCETIASNTNASFEGGNYIVEAGFAQSEVAAASYVLPATAFPIKIVSTEGILATSNSSITTETQWSVVVYSGTPSAGTLVATISSNGKEIPHAQIGPGTNGLNVMLVPDPNDPIVVNDDGSHTFTIGYRIDHHNLQSGNPCFTAPPTCCNAFPVVDVSGVSTLPGNWLRGVNCGSFGCPPNGGWASFQALTPGLCRPSGDWVVRATWASTSCQPGVCYPDCNGDTNLDLADFGCYQTKFALGDLYADCNADGVRNLADFGCFQTKFALGCP